MCCSLKQVIKNSLTKCIQCNDNNIKYIKKIKSREKQIDRNINSPKHYEKKSLKKYESNKKLLNQNEN